jgi:BNR-Asp box repeat protein
MADKLLRMTFLRGSSQIALLALGVVASSGGGYLSHAQVSAATNTAAPALPSGLAPVSQLVVERSQLALDSNGTLFRSEDQGKHWHQVHQQWDGKAVELLGIPPLTAAPGSGQAPRSDSDQEPYAAVLLRSTTELHWVSVDRGKTWKPSTLDDVRRNDVKWSGN